MHVAIDGRHLASPSRRRGIGTYLRGLLDGLQGRTDEIALTLIGSGIPQSATLGFDGSISPPWLPSRVARRDRLGVAWTARRIDADVLHVPALPSPAMRLPPRVVTVHDLFPLTHAHLGLDPTADRFRRWLGGLRDARVIIAPSRFTADELMRVVGLDASRIHVVPFAAGHIPTTSSTAPTEDASPYLLVVGELDPRKGHDRAIEVVARVAEAGFPHRLRISGQLPDHLLARRDRLIRGASRPDLVDFLGFVDDLASLYAGADCVLVTSHAEGFGFSALEAMRAGRPLVAWANTATIEVVGDGGVLVPDGDIDAFAASVIEVLREPRFAAELVERGRRRAAEFSWEQTASGHVEAWRAAM